MALLTGQQRSPEGSRPRRATGCLCTVALIAAACTPATPGTASADAGPSSSASAPPPAPPVASSPAAPSSSAPPTPGAPAPPPRPVASVAAPKVERSIPLTVRSLALSPRASLLSAGSHDGRLLLLSASTLIEQRSWPCELVGPIAFSADEKRLAAVCKTSDPLHPAEVRVVQVVGGAAPVATLSSEGPLQALAWRGDHLLIVRGNRLAEHALSPTPREVASSPASTVSRDGSSSCLFTDLRMYERPMPGGGHAWVAPGRKVTCSFGGGPSREVASGLHGEVIPLVGAYLVADTYESTLYSYSGARTGHVVHGFLGSTARPSSDGRYLAALDGLYLLRLFETSSGRVLWQRTLGGESSIAVSQEGVVFVGSPQGLTRFARPSP